MEVHAMPGRKQPMARKRVDLEVYSIEAFCTAHHISRSMYYKLRKDGKAPHEMKVGRKRMIARDEAARWRNAQQETR
jgi:hypothetical protein